MKHDDTLTEAELLGLTTMTKALTECAKTLNATDYKSVCDIAVNVLNDRRMNPHVHRAIIRLLTDLLDTYDKVYGAIDEATATDDTL